MMPNFVLPAVSEVDVAFELPILAPLGTTVVAVVPLPVFVAAEHYLNQLFQQTHM
jgi:hypothetical protein